MVLQNFSKIILVLLVFSLLLAGCVQQNTDTTKGSGLMTLDANKTDTNGSGVYNNLDNFKKVQNGDKVSVNYTGRLKDGTVFDSSIGGEPLDFEVGAGQMIKGFDSAVLGMKVGETKTVELQPSEAYGEYNMQLVRVFDKNSFADFAQINEGMYVYAGNGAKGKVLYKTDTNAVIDFNPALAGKVLVFDITLLSIN